jgi:nucleoside-diphosphate-sugar epimerase
MDYLHLVEGDLQSYHSVHAAISSSAPQVVAHLGALTPVRYSFEDPFPYASINYEGTVNLIHSLIEYSPSTKLVLASTAEVYGWHEASPIPETSHLNPSSPYAVSKLAADKYAQMASRVYGLKSTILRCNNTYGRVGEAGFLTEYIISRMLKNETVYLGAPNHVRDYMYVDDHVQAYVLAIEERTEPADVFNVSPGNPVTNMQLAEEVAKIVGYSARIVQNSYPPGYPIRPAEWDTEYIVLDSSRIRQRLGWRPKLSLHSGLEKAIELWKQHSS